MLSFRRKGSCFLVLAVAACGGSSFTAAPMTGGEGGAEAGAESGAAEGGGSVDAAGAEGGGGDAGAPRDGGGGTADGATDAPATQDASDAGMPCPAVRGTYMVTLVTGAAGGTGCGDLDPSAAQCIRQPVGSCTIDFISNVSGGGPPAINGSAMLGADGAFGMATLTEGTVDRTGCTGLWNPVTSTMTIDCGGVGSSQSCVAKLARTGVAVVCN
jgi:hypothetical protein